MKLNDSLRQLTPRSPRFWIHNSSMGEFEQAKPLAAELRKRFPDSLIVISFFSPSGFEHVTACAGADYLTYLPFDTVKKARRFIQILKPDAAIFIRHDFWPNHLGQLNRMGIPAVLVNCSVGTRHFNHFLSALFQRFLYGFFDDILTISETAKLYCEAHHLGRGQVTAVGDTRYDQVMHRAKEAETIIAPLKKIKGDRRCFVAGSTWPVDEAVIFDALKRLDIRRERLWIVIVPHEPHPDHLAGIEDSLMDLRVNCMRFSRIDSADTVSNDVLIVDRVGILASLYALGDVTYVGGGFNQGLHSVLEPAVFGKPVLFGPKHHNSYEAGQMKKRGAGFSVNDSDGLYCHLHHLLSKPERLDEIGGKAEKTVHDNIGATARIIDHLEKRIRGV